MSEAVKMDVVDMARRKTASGGSKWEPLLGYSRAVRSGNTIAVSGTVGANADGSYSADVGQQARRSLQIIEAAITTLGGTLEHVIRTRIYMTDVSEWEKVAKVHGELFGNIRPATTLIQVAKLIDADAKIEIEADAIVA